MGAIIGLNPLTDVAALKFTNEVDLIVMVGFDPIEFRDAWLDVWPKDEPFLTID